MFIKINCYQHNMHWSLCIQERTVCAFAYSIWDGHLQSLPQHQDNPTSMILIPLYFYCAYYKTIHCIYLYNVLQVVEMAPVLLTYLFNCLLQFGKAICLAIIFFQFSQMMKFHLCPVFYDIYDLHHALSRNTHTLSLSLSLSLSHSDTTT